MAWRVTALAVCACTAVAAAAVSEELRAARTAQCRAMCLDEYHVATLAPPGDCLKRTSCLTCWEKCGSLNPAADDGTSTSCSLLPDCEDAGCRRACQFHASPRAAPPARLSDGPRLELSWDGAEARWLLSGPASGQLRSNVVFLLLAGTADGWKELVQTSEVSAVLVNLRRDTPLRLLAVTRQGLLATADARLQPQQPSGEPTEQQRWLQSRQQQPDGVWLLETVAVERDSSSMVLVQIGWQPQAAGPAPAQYLVTWELSGGGIKGHLYTDINSVTLSLWPESVYNIQVELLSVTSQRSVPLVISTYQEEAVVGRRATLQPGHMAALALLAAVLLGALAAVVALLSRRCRWRHLRSAGPAPCRLFVLTSAGRQKRVLSPLRSVLVKACRAPAPVHTPLRS